MEWNESDEFLNRVNSLCRGRLGHRRRSQKTIGFMRKTTGLHVHRAF